MIDDPLDTDSGAIDVSRRQPLVVILLAVGLGILIDRYVPQPALIWSLVTVAGLLAWGVARLRRAMTVGIVALLVACAGIAALWHHACWNQFGESELGYFSRDTYAPIVIRARALDAPKFIPAPPDDPLRNIPAVERSRLTIEALAIRDGSDWLPVSGKATLLVDGTLLGIEPGDRIEVWGRFVRPSAPDTDGEFDFAEYRRTQRQLCLIRVGYPDCVTMVERGSPWDPRTWIVRLRRKGSDLLWSYLGHRRAGLAAAVLLGERDRLEYDRTEAFVETGTVHLLAISGLHVGILVSVLMFGLRLGWLPRVWGLVAIVGLTCFYALLTDARPPVLRATVLIVVICLAMAYGRRPLGFNSLAAAALIVLAWNPTNLFRVGTQLSFLAVATLICMGPVWRRWQQQDALAWLVASTRPWPERIARRIGTWFWRLGLAGLAVWAVALPLVMLHFHLLSPAGFLLTPFLYIPIAVALISGLGVLVFGWLLPPIASLFGAVCDMSLGLVESAVTWTRGLPFSHYWMASPSGAWVLLFYATCALWIFAPRWRPSKGWSAVAVALWIVIAAVNPATWFESERLTCTFIAVGQGNAVLVQYPDGRTLLYDAGRMGASQAATRAISSVLWSRGLTHLDAIMISHADSDHFSSLPELLERFSVGVVYVTPVMKKDDSRAVLAMFEAVRRAGVAVKTVALGDRLATGDVRTDVLHPYAHGVFQTMHGSVDNANSIVLVLEYQGRRILLPGDLEGVGLATLLDRPSTRCDVLLAPHHGSPNSRPYALAAWSQPDWTVVISGSAPVASDVRRAYTERGGRMLKTADHGTVDVVIQEGNVTVDWHHLDTMPAWSCSPSDRADSSTSSSSHPIDERL